MHVGAVFSQADSGVDSAAVRAWAMTADQAGLHHLMAYDHVLGAPAERLGEASYAPFPAPPYTDLSVFHEVLTLFAHLAAVTTAIEFVPSVLVLPQRQAAVAAKQIATVDRLSGGRLNVAVGVGWNHAEYEGLGADFANRSAILEEQTEVLRMLLVQRLVTFTGQFHELDRVGINPLPDRSIPIWMGTGGNDAALRRVVRAADGWMPLIAPAIEQWTIADRVARLHQISEDHGRDPATLPVWGRIYLDGSDAWRAQADQAAALGFSHLSLGLDRFARPGTPHDEHLASVIDVLDEVRAIVGPDR